MSVGPFWNYYGGKWRAAPRYPAPEYGVIVEPFAGAAGYSCRYPSRRVHLYDVDEHVVGTWRYLLATPSAEIAALPDVPEGGTVDDIGACQEARWLVGWWCNTGASSPRKSPSVWNREGHALCWSDVRERVARQADLIRHWTIEQRPWWSIPDDYDATWYVDPPYSTPAGRYYRHSEIDYPALGEWCQALPGQVIACEQTGADWLPFRHFAHISGLRTTAGRRNEEVIWTSGRGHQTQLLEQ